MMRTAFCKGQKNICLPELSTLTDGYIDIVVKTCTPASVVRM